MNYFEVLKFEELGLEPAGAAASLLAKSQADREQELIEAIIITRHMLDVLEYDYERLKVQMGKYDVIS